MCRPSDLEGPQVIEAGIETRDTRAREAGFMFVACRSCAKSRGNEAGVGGGRRGVASCDVLYRFVTIQCHSSTEPTSSQTFPSLSYSKHSIDYSRHPQSGLEGLGHSVSMQDRKHHRVALLEQLKMTIVAVLGVVNHSMTRTQTRLQVFLRVGVLASQEEQTGLWSGQRERRIDEEDASCTILEQDRVKGSVQK